MQFVIAIDGFTHSFHFTRTPNGCQKFNEAIRQGLAAPDWRDPLAAVGADLFVMSPGEFGAFAKAQIERWGVSIKKYGIRLEQ